MLGWSPPLTNKSLFASGQCLARFLVKCRWGGGGGGGGNSVASGQCLARFLVKCRGGGGGGGGSVHIRWG